MSLVVPNTLGNSTTSISLSLLDENFAYFRDQLNPYVNAITIGSSNAVTHLGTTTLNAALTYGGVTLTNAVTGTAKMVLSDSPAITGTATFVNLTSNDATASTSTTTGSVKLAGGLGVVGAIHAGSVNTNTLKSTTGALTTIPTGYSVKGTDVGSVYAPGTVIQVQTAVSNTMQTIASLTPVAVTGLSIDFTPKFSTSKIVIMCSMSISKGHVMSLGVFKNGATTVTTSGNSNEANMQITIYEGSDNTQLMSVPLHHVETAGDTTMRTYAVYATAGWGGTTYTMYVNNRSGSDMASQSNMTIMEIAQ